MNIRLNIRAGPILALTWDDMTKIREDGYILSSEHKTGSYYDITITVDEDQLKWLERLKEQYFTEFNTISSAVMPSSANDTEHSMARNIQQFVFKEYDQTGKYDYNSNAIRKSWDTYVNRNAGRMSSAALASHYQQSGHTKETATKEYVRPQEALTILQFYRNELDASSSSHIGDCDVIEVLSSDTESLPKSTTPRAKKATKRSGSSSSTTPAGSSSTTPVNRPANSPDSTTPGISPPRLALSKASSKSSFALSDSDPEYSASGSSDDSDSAPVEKKMTISSKTPDLAKYMKSVCSWRRQQPSVNEIEAVKLFTDIKQRIGKKQIEELLDGCSIVLTESEKRRILVKIQQAMVYLPKPN